MRSIRKFYKRLSKIITFTGIDPRSLRLISSKLMLNLVRLAVALILLTIISSFYIYFYQPQYIGKIKYRSLLLLSKYTNVNFNKFRIVINGAVKSDKRIISDIIDNKYKTQNISDSLIGLNELIKEIKSKQKWIDSIHIFRSLPNLINVNIVEYVPFAIWKDHNNYYVVDSNGQIIPINSDADYDHLIVLSGNNAYSQVKSLFNIMAINPEISSRIYSATWVGNRRWDLRFDNSLLIKMPSSQITNSWKKLVKLYNTNGSFYNLKTIDLRIKDKIYLEYNNIKS